MYFAAAAGDCAGEAVDRPLHFLFRDLRIHDDDKFVLVQDVPLRMKSPARSE
jgi:hypothetical protein